MTDRGQQGFDVLLDEVKTIINATPDREKMCRENLASVEQNVAQIYRSLQADTKAHPNHQAANDQKIHQLAITLGNALTAYVKCMRTLPLRPA